MCQKQMQMLKELGVNVEATNNKTLLVCQKADLVIEYTVHRDCWFIRGGDGRKYLGFDEMLKKFKQLEGNPEINNQGLTVRDYFATHAMEGMVTDVVIDPQQIASMAYELADAIMKEREVRRG
jgi:hypothetical protein